MRIFVWIAYGSSSVYLADTQERLQNIYKEIRDTLEDFYDKEEFEEIFGPELSIVTERNILDLIDNFGGLSVHESFEWGTTFTTAKG